MKKKIKLSLPLLCSYLLVLFIGFFAFNVNFALASETNMDKLIEKVSNDFTKKFCNGVGFGLSKESAIDFAIKENNLVFKNRKGIENLNEELISSKIAISVIDRCGYPLDLNGEKGINQFQNDYISAKKKLMLLN